MSTLDDHAHGVDIFELLGLDHFHAHPVGTELPEQDVGNGFGKGLQELQPVLGHQAPQPLVNDAVVDGVANTVGVAGAGTPQACAHIDDQCLRTVQLTVVDADHRLAFKAFYEDQVHWRLRAIDNIKGGSERWSFIYQGGLAVNDMGMVPPGNRSRNRARPAPGRFGNRLPAGEMAIGGPPGSLLGFAAW